MTVIRKLIDFWKRPTENHHSLTKKELITLFMIIFPLGILMTIVQNYFSVTYTQGETFEWKQVLLPTGFSLASLKLILVYFLLGIVEEFAFRWWLKKKWLKKYFVIFVWISLFCFVIVHAQPWNLEPKYWVWIPLMTLGPLVGGLALTYIRLHSSLKDAIIFHCLNNLIGVILFIILGLLLLGSASNVEIGI